jgi:hypothetical protein
VAIISVDLAYKTYSDVGAVVLREHRDHVCGELLPIPLAGQPSPADLARFLNQYCADAGVRVLLLDGPQGWKAVDSALADSRCCERELNTPAKTGLPGSVKPAAYLEFVSFSIQVFDEMCNLGWVRLSCVGAALHPKSRVVIESFPLSAWRSLRIAPLPAKRKTKAKDLEASLQALGGILTLHLSGTPTHDQLQAVVAGLAGLAVEKNNWNACVAAGVPPFADHGCWREGFILNATAGIREALSNTALEPSAPTRVRAPRLSAQR